MDDAEKNKVLIVDDEAHIRHVMKLKLENAGFEVLLAEDGEQALEIAIQHLPSLVITDYQMPYMDGLTLCAMLRGREETRCIPCMILTARGLHLDQEEFNQSNIASVMSKPFSPREILDCVKQLIDGQPSSQEPDS